MSLKYSWHDLFNYNIPGMNYAISISLAARNIVMA
jgi:hypothetical protein